MNGEETTMSTPQAETTGTEDTASPISTIAGTETAGSKGDDGPAVSAQLNRPYGLAVDSTGTLYFSDYFNHRVRKVTPDGTISTAAGTGAAGFGGDGGSATAARINYALGAVVDGDGVLYVSDHGNHRVRKVTADGSPARRPAHTRRRNAVAAASWAFLHASRVRNRCAA